MSVDDWNEHLRDLQDVLEDVYSIDPVTLTVEQWGHFLLRFNSWLAAHSSTLQSISRLIDEREASV